MQFAIRRSFLSFWAAVLLLFSFMFNTSPAESASGDPSLPLMSIGKANQAAKDFLITEGAAEALKPRGNRELRLYAPMGVSFSDTPRFEVIQGDLVLESASAQTEYDNSFRQYYASVRIKASSTTPSTIRVSSLRLTVDRTVPEGNVVLQLKGWNNAAVEYNDDGLFPSSLMMTIPVGWVGTPGEHGAPASQPAVPAGKKVALFKIGETKYIVDTVEKEMDTTPYRRNGRVFLPIRYISDMLGIEPTGIVWDEKMGQVTLTRVNRVIILELNNPVMYADGSPVTLEAAPEIVEPGRVMLPVRPIVEQYGGAVEWDSATETVRVFSQE
ncbi:hypothetical protein GTO91_17400 [Heliobacterium undosum]|uniref:Copper amine oxidase-like N-terminal domain-containing protein n=1 Tax=Heliomicrobium undosum TaxID=121734 RepID=A0A845LA22_9FIRM|nr:copper amine oxidase N-terminal domain-containing protein [Heliomicrobium undosum]MZP31470.1 hypothetical protein [Heliomicrobium undosum]